MIVGEAIINLELEPELEGKRMHELERKLTITCVYWRWPPRRLTICSAKVSTWKTAY